MEKKKILLTVAAGTVVFLLAGTGLGVYWVVGQYHQTQQTLQDTQNLLHTESGALTSAQQNIQNLQKQSQATIKNTRPAFLSAGTATPKPISVSAMGLPALIQEWRPRVAYVDCTFSLNGQPYVEKTGSGVLALYYNKLMPSIGNYYVVVTNKHVVSANAPDGSSLTPDSCNIKFPGNQYSFIAYPSTQDAITGTTTLEHSAYGYDEAMITVDSPGAYAKKYAMCATGNSCVCAGTPSVGDGLVVLGYPAIGSPTDITATEGIVSGFDGDYVITSAKIDEGNSGGAAISTANDCFLGMPTYADVGQISSLGRILGIGAMLK